MKYLIFSYQFFSGLEINFLINIIIEVVSKYSKNEYSGFGNTNTFIAKDIPFSMSRKYLPHIKPKLCNKIEDLEVSHYIILFKKRHIKKEKLRKM